jgi:hypothetical protein
VKCSEGVRKRVYIIIGRYTDHMKFAAYKAFRLSHSFIFFWLYFLSLHIWLYALYASLYFFFLFIFIIMFMCSDCYVCFFLGFLFHCVVLCAVCM